MAGGNAIFPILLTTMLIIYVFIGAWIFQLINDPQIENDFSLIRQNKSGISMNKCKNVSPSEIKDFAEWSLLADRYNVRERFLDIGQGHVHVTAQELEEFIEDSASLYHYVLYAATLVTTVGYGYYAPITYQGQVLTIFYIIIGLVQIGTILALMSLVLDKLFHKRQDAFELFVTIVVCTVGWILLPALLIQHYEQDPEVWSFFNSVYYAYITVSTIGLGDFVTTPRPVDFGAASYLYKAFVITWLLTGFFCWAFMITRVMAILNRCLNENTKMLLDSMAPQSALGITVQSDAGLSVSSVQTDDKMFLEYYIQNKAVIDSLISQTCYSDHHVRKYDDDHVVNNSHLEPGSEHATSLVYKWRHSRIPGQNRYNIR